MGQWLLVLLLTFIGLIIIIGLITIHQYNNQVYAAGSPCIESCVKSKHVGITSNTKLKEFGP